MKLKDLTDEENHALACAILLPEPGPGVVTSWAKKLAASRRKEKALAVQVELMTKSGAVLIRSRKEATARLFALKAKLRERDARIAELLEAGERIIINDEPPKI